MVSEQVAVDLMGKLPVVEKVQTVPEVEPVGKMVPPDLALEVDQMAPVLEVAQTETAEKILEPKARSD